jgi:protein-glutamine gamma-glutamyltransferase
VIGLTGRGRSLLACGLAALVFARLFGTRDVALLGGALVAAVLIARVWVGRAGGPHVALRTLPPFAHAGDRVEVLVELRPLEGARSGRASFRETGARAVCALRPVSDGGLRVLRGSYELGPLDRGVLELGPGELEREDPFGLARRVDATRGSTALTVIAPALELPGVALGGGGELTAVRPRLRSGGHELRGVREHQPGEPLRGVHWPSTAHRGRLMVKEQDDPGGDQLAVVLDARASADVGDAPGSSFELALGAAEALVAHAHADGRRVRLIVAGPDGEPVSASERAAVRRLLARARPAGERRPAEVLARVSAEQIEVVTTRPADLVGAPRARRLGVVAIDPSSFDPAIARDAAALAALRAAGAHVQEVRRPERREAAAERAAVSRGAAAWHWLLFALAGVLGLLHARGLQTPALSTPRLVAVALLAVAPALAARRRRRRAALLAAAAGTLAATWLATDRPPALRAPLGGLAGQLADAPSAWVRVTLPYSASEHPELRTAVLLAVFAWVAALAWFALARRRPLAAALLAVAPFVLSATVYDLSGYPLRAAAATGLLLAFLVTGRPAGGGRGAAAAFAALAVAAGAAVAAVPAASRPAVLPWTTWTFSQPRDDSSAVGLVWDMRYRPLSFGPKPVEVLRVRAPRPSYWRAVVLSGFDGLRFLRQPQATVGTSQAGGFLRVPGAPGGAGVRAEVQIEALADPFLVAPGQPVSYDLPVAAGAVDLLEDGSAELRLAPPAGVEYVSRGTLRNPSAQTLRALPGGYPQAIAGSGLGFDGEVLPAFGTPARERDLAVLFASHRGDPTWDAWRLAYAAARAQTRNARSPYQTIVALEAWLRTTRAYDEHASLPDRPDALALWAARGTAGHCQMFAASLAALARLSGVPARVAEGFAPGDLRSGVYRVTDRDAHAWVEAWFPGYGWLPFDATPGRDLPERASSSSAAFDGAAAEGPQPAGGAATGALGLPLARLRAVLATGAAAGGPDGRSWWRSQVALWPAALTAFAAALLLLKRAILQVALPRDPAARARRRVSAFLADQGWELGPALTPRELAATIGRRYSVEASGFAAALERAAYAPAAPGDAARLARQTDALLRDLRRALGRARRLRGLVSPASVSRGRAR